MKKTTGKKVVKAWAVVSSDTIDSLWDYVPNDFSDEDGGWHYMTYTTKKIAQKRARFHNAKVVPCTITYEL